MPYNLFHILCMIIMIHFLWVHDCFSFSLLCCVVFKELLARLSEEKRNGAPHLPKIGDIKKASRYSIPDLAVDVEQVIGLEKVTKKSKANTVGGRNKLKKILDKTRISILPQKPYKWVCYIGQWCFSLTHSYLIYLDIWRMHFLALTAECKQKAQE